VTTPVHTGRSEKRTPRKVLVEISREDELLLKKEEAFTENVSPRGARVGTERAWLPGTNVLVVSTQDAVRLRAKIVYCQALGVGRFTIGLELSAPADQWLKPPRSA
jgi:hypothetical protein